MDDLSDPTDRYSTTIIGPVAVARPPAVIAARARIYGVVTIPPRRLPYRKSGLPGPHVRRFDELYPYYRRTP